MVSEHVMVCTLVVVLGTALAQQDKCGTNEVWMNCGTCERSCLQANPICTRECKKPGCYCPAGQFVRVGYTKKCAPVADCPTLAKPRVTKRQAEQKCGENEQWTNCGSCHQDCDSDKVVRACPAMCFQQCQCKAGFVRGWNGKCIAKSHCTAHPECASTSCAAGTICVHEPKQCFVAPCPQVACVKPAPNARNQ
ncbi:hypothetical protein L596_013876 [Steinernema carpocapsae]|uniref:TIL domain-containing protein n=1 Tax=Steinernema carpocapsae TaxID=34508 RepID=A0A4U5P2U0_STECR|nr:hypothetical protein L596_013876 [Steinernema carpocapsae]